MTEQQQATEFSRRRNLPGVQVRYMNGKRYSDTQLSLCGRELGSKSSMLSRGKVVSTSYYLPELEGGQQC